MGRKWKIGSNQARKIVTKLISRDGSLCVWCGRETRRSDSPVPDQQTIDHVIPYSQSGEAHIANYMLACRECNEDRGSLTVEEYLGLAKAPNHDLIQRAQHRARNHDWLLG